MSPLPPRYRSVLDSWLHPRIVQFVLVGGLGACLDTGLLVALHGGLGVALAAAKIAGAEASILLMFAVNEHWTFDRAGRRSGRALARRLLTSNLVRIGGLAVGTAVLVGLARMGIHYVLANGAGLLAGVTVNYCCESLFTWRVHRDG